MLRTILILIAALLIIVAAQVKGAEGKTPAQTHFGEGGVSD